MPSWAELLQRQNSRKIYTAHATLARDDGMGGVETKTLRLASECLHPRRTAFYFEPRIQGLPTFRRSLQELFLGKSQTGYGRLDLLNGDGELDSDVTDWHWAGQPVVISLGFAELDQTDYQPVLTCRMGSPASDDDVMRVPIKDYHIDLERAELAEGDYTNTVPNLVSACLSAAGITDIDTTLWDAWAAVNNFAGFISSGPDNIRNLLDRILAPLACWYGFDRAGQFILGVLEPPDAGPAELDLTGDIEPLKFQSKEISKQFWKLEVEYLTATSPSQTYGIVSREDTGILTLNPSAEDAKRRTPLTAQADALTIRDRWWDLFSVRRRVLPVTAMVQPAGLRLHDQVYLARERYGVAHNYRAVMFEDNLSASQIKMELFR